MNFALDEGSWFFNYSASFCSSACSRRWSSDIRAKMDRIATSLAMTDTLGEFRILVHKWPRFVFSRHRPVKR